MADKLHRITQTGSIVRFEFKGDDTRVVPEISSNLTVSSGDIEFIGSLTVNGNINAIFEGPGAVPPGGVIGIMPHLAGAYNCTATTVADSQGFVQCNGQTIVDATSPMNGVTIPNINNNTFLAGNTTSGTTGGVNSYAISSAMLPPHTHTVDHTHSFNTADASSTTTGANSAPNTDDASPASLANCSFTSGGVNSPYPSDYTDTVSANHTHSGSSAVSGNHTHTYSRLNTLFTSELAHPADANLNFAVSTSVHYFDSYVGSHTHSYSVSSSDAHTHTISTHSHGAPHSHSLSSHTHTLSSHTHSMNSHTHSIGSLPFSGSSGPGSFANTTLENRPVYLTVKYIIRIK